MDLLGGAGTAGTGADSSSVVGVDSVGVECEEGTLGELGCSVGGIEGGGKVFGEFYVGIDIGKTDSRTGKIGLDDAFIVLKGKIFSWNTTCLLTRKE